MKLREMMPELTGATKWINGQVTKTDLIGYKPTLFHFWSVSCHLCKKALPDLHRLRDQYKELQLIAVHMPRKEEDGILENIQAVVNDHDIIQPVFVDGELLLTEAFANQYVPAYYLFDKSGKLRHFQAGSGSLKMLEKRIVRVLEESTINGDEK